MKWTPRVVIGLLPRLYRISARGCMKKGNPLRMLELVALVACSHALAHAQSAYPTKPVRIVVPTSPASAGDVFARVLSQPLSERLGQPVVVDTRPGGGTVIGTEIVARAAPDGHTLLVALPGLAITPAIHPKLPYEPLRDFAAITQG